ncbi:MAG: glycosyltransferase [Candidatus Omnitrophica bacterium]|nr:glycosyltransferase [Candidatus Omnitrophota bacterium]
MKLSIIVPIYNEGLNAGRLAENLMSRAKGEDEFEILLCNDDSQDDTASIIDAIAREHAQVRSLHYQFRNPYLVRNAASQEAKGLYLGFSDSDVTFCDNYISKIFNLIETGKQLIFGPYLPEPSGFFMRQICDYEKYRLGYRKKHFPDLTTAYGGNMVVLKSAFENLGRFDCKRRGGDRDFCIRFYEKFGSVQAVYDPSLVCFHHEIKSVNDYVRRSVLYKKKHQMFEETFKRRISIFQELQTLYSWKAAGDGSWLSALFLLAIMTQIKIRSL